MIKSPVMKQGIFVYTTIASFAMGVALYSCYNFGWAFIGLLIFVATTMLLVVVTIGKCNRTIALVVLTLLAFALGAARMHVAVQPAPTELVWQVGKSTILTGTIVAEPDRRANHTNLVLKALSGEKILIRADAYTEFAYGDTVKITGKLEEPQVFASSEGERSFNYPRYLAKNNIYYIIAYPKIEVVSQGNGNFIKRWLFVTKSAYLEAIERSVPEPASALAGGITVGAKRSLGAELEEDFRKTGIIHIVVLSGYNVMIIATFLLWALSFVSPRIGAAIGALLIVLFTIMTGAGATIVRASAMGLLSLYAAQTGRTYVAMRALAIVAFFMLMWNPKILIADISFQLSFVATLGLIFGLSIFKMHSNPLLGNTYADEGAVFNLGFKDILVATVSTQIAVLPLILYYMGNFSLVAIIVNMLVLPAVPLAMLAVFITGTVGMVSTFMSVPLGWVSYILLEYILKVVDIFANLPFASLHVGAFSFWWAVFAYALFGCLFVALRRNIPVNV